LDVKKDESYTPSRIAVFAGPRIGPELAEVGSMQLEDPEGWVSIPVGVAGHGVRAFVFVIAITANHQNGRDSKMRQVHIIGPKKDFGTSTTRSVPVAAYATVR